MKVGDLVKFGFVYTDCDLNHKRAVYLGEDFLHRSDGIIVRNHKVLVVGASNTTCIDQNLLKYMEVINENR